MPVSKTRILVVLMFGILAASFASIIIRLTPAPSLVVAAGRMLFATILLTPFYFAQPALRKQELKLKKLLLSLLGGVFLAAHFGFWIESLRHTTVTSSVVLVAMNPIFVALLSPFLIREGISPRLWIAIILGILGALIINKPAMTNTGNLNGNLLALTGALFAALYVLVGRKLRPGLSLLGYVYPVYFIAALILTILAFISGNPLATCSLKTCLLILLLAIGPQIIGHTSFNWALAYLPASVVALTILGEPVGTTLLAMILLRQPPTCWEIMGGIIILSAIYLASTGFNLTKNGAPV
jgi:drug/metabolite transporter (DMT)-like permease|uniref:DMT family transporter n=1 Tax=candidate division WOR-3 bacterium TaxID=2052148 RepID=A0A7V3PUD3_UNCW3